MTRRRRQAPTRRYFPKDWFLVHRGADPGVIEEIVTVLGAEAQHVTVAGDYLGQPPVALRRLVDERFGRNADEDCIVLLNRHLDGRMFRQTFAPLAKTYPHRSICAFRIEDCPLGDVKLECDLVDVREPAERRRQMLQIVPSSASLISTESLLGSIAAIAIALGRKPPSG
jgi:hypothetical protein